MDCGYIDPATHEEVDSLYREIGAKLSAMISRADDFCKNAPDHDYLRDQPGTYHVGDDDL